MGRLTDKKDSPKHGFDTVPIRKTVRRKRRSNEAMGKRKSEGDKKDMGEDSAKKLYGLLYNNVI